VSRIRPEDLAACFDAHARGLLLYARQLCGDRDAEDVVQEAFVKLSRMRRVPEHPAAWLFRVVRNGALDVARGHRRRDRRESRVSRREAWFDSADDRLDAALATAHLAELEPEIRSVVVARVWGNLTFDEIAQAEGCSVAAAHRRYRAGLAQLAERLGEPCPTN
jgi:RNA polymerase sigma-70 factor (ECF subfamily)